MTLLSCEMDVRVGGRYRLVFGHDGSKPMAFFGRYLEVTPHSRLVWTNEESGDGAVTTVTFEEKGGKTLLVLHELYPSKEALDAAIAGTDGRDARDVRAAGRASRHPNGVTALLHRSRPSSADAPMMTPSSARKSSLPPILSPFLSIRVESRISPASPVVSDSIESGSAPRLSTIVAAPPSAPRR